MKYLMPVSAELRVKKGEHESLMNTMEFREYKRFDGNGGNRASASEKE